MSELYHFIATKTTYDVVLPEYAGGDPTAYFRKIRLALKAMAGGITRCGDVIGRATAAAVPNHLLCDGSTINRADFPELADVLGVGEGATTFTLPDYTNAAPALPADPPTQTIEGGTVSTGGTVTTPTQPGQAGGSIGGGVPSGGRERLSRLADLR